MKYLRGFPRKSPESHQQMVSETFSSNGLECETHRHEHLVLVVIVGGCEDICTLQCLREEAEDIVDDKNGFGSGRRTRVVWVLSASFASEVSSISTLTGLHAIYSDELALLFLLYVSNRSFRADSEHTYPSATMGGVLQHAAEGVCDCDIAFEQEKMCERL